MQASTDTTYRHVQGLSRGLRILRALNDADPVGSTPRDLSDKTKINRTTVKRLLETLAEEGYVRASECEGRYGIAPDVLQLSRGMTEDNRVLAHCVQAMKQLGHDTGWSLRITTPLGGRMVIRDSTHPSSNLAAEAWGGLRHTLPILLTAAGRAFFAHSDDAVRQGIVDDIRSQRDEQTPLANNAKLVEQLVRRVLADGHAVNDGAWGQRHLGAVAVPIRRPEGRTVASLSMLYARSVVSPAAVEQELVPALQRCAMGIRASL